MSPPRDLVCRVGGAATGVKLGRDGTRCVGAGGDSGSDFHHEQFQWGGVHQQADTDLGMTWQHKITSILRSTTTEYVTADGEVKTVMSRKGKPGDDSVNACIPWTIERCK